MRISEPTVSRSRNTFSCRFFIPTEFVAPCNQQNDETSGILIPLDLNPLHFSLTRTPVHCMLRRIQDKFILSNASCICMLPNMLDRVSRLARKVSMCDQKLSHTKITNHCCQFWLKICYLDFLSPLSHP